MRVSRAMLPLAIGAFAVLTGPAEPKAIAVTPAVQQNCKWDYSRYCSDYGLGTALLTLCFHKNGAKLSPGCVRALIAAGDVSKTYVLAEEKALGR